MNREVKEFSSLSIGDIFYIAEYRYVKLDSGSAFNFTLGAKAYAGDYNIRVFYAGERHFPTIIAHAAAEHS
jgi:hypothetical protein